MKKIIALLSILIILLIAVPPVQAKALRFRSFTQMQAVNGASLNDGDSGIVVTLQDDATYPLETHTCTLDADSGVAESLPTVVSFTSNANDKRFLCERVDGMASGTTAGGDLTGTYPDPSVTNDSHDHTTTTISGLLDADIGPDLTINSTKDITTTANALIGAGASALGSGSMGEALLKISEDDRELIRTYPAITNASANLILFGSSMQDATPNNFVSLLTYHEVDIDTTSGSAYGHKSAPACRESCNLTEWGAGLFDLEWYSIDGTETGTIDQAFGVKAFLKEGSGMLADQTLTSYKGVWSTAIDTGAGAGDFLGTDWALFYGTALPATFQPANLTGLWLEQQTTGTTNNYGIVLDGDREGSDIVLGEDQDAKIFHFGGANTVQADYTSQPTDGGVTGWQAYITADSNLFGGKIVTANKAKIELLETKAAAAFTLYNYNGELKINGNTAAESYDEVYGFYNLLRLDGTNGTQTITTYASFKDDFFDNGTGNIDGTNWYHFYASDFPAFGGTVTNTFGMYIEDQTYGSNNYGIVLADDADGIYLNGTATPTIKVHGDGTNGAITVNAGLDVVGIPTGTTANGALGGGEAVVGAVCMSNSNEIYIDTDGSCAD